MFSSSQNFDSSHHRHEHIFALLEGGKNNAKLYYLWLFLLPAPSKLYNAYSLKFVHTTPQIKGPSACGKTSILGG